ncbi:uncharacterized protein LOC142232652 [Haematobia irritans]|uniref:uncharacterized protein LOC142232652 n=1 Tax=Haematobia irritans TaxID=7368 RepID=UPI003F4FE638
MPTDLENKNHDQSMENITTKSEGQMENIKDNDMQTKGVENKDTILEMSEVTSESAPKAVDMKDDITASNQNDAATLPIIPPIETAVTTEEASTEKPSDPWHDFDDKFSLLEHRYPDLTKEEFQEIHKEDSIPWNFLKGLAITQDKEKEIIPLVKPLSSISAEAIPETPVYITIPIVINSHSMLPISLSIGGAEVPLSMGLKDKDHVSPMDQLNKQLTYTSPPLRTTNRHRNNMRTKIYARNKRHQVFEFKREI